MCKKKETLIITVDTVQVQEIPPGIDFGVNFRFSAFQNILIKNFTGIDSPYEVPEHPELDLITDGRSEDECAEQVITYLKRNGYIVWS